MATHSVKYVVTAATEKAQAALGKLEKTIKKHEKGLKSLQKASTIAFAGIAALGTGAVIQASKMENLRVQLDTLTGSAEKGKKIFMEIQEFAAKTPFANEELVKATNTMLSFWVAQENVMGDMKMLGDISMGNKDRLQSLSLAYSQVQSAGRLMGQDLLQMINAWFNPLQIISEETGKSMSELKDEMADGAISAQMVTDAMKKATSEGGRFFWGMEKASKTFSGVLSTLRDNLSIALAAAAGFADGEVVEGGLLDMLTKWMEKLMPHLDAFAQWASENGKIVGIVLGITAALTGFVAVVTTIGLAIPGMIAGMTALGAAFTFMTWPVGIVIAVIAALTAGLIWLWHNSDMVNQAIVKGWIWVRTKLLEFLAVIENAIRAGMAKIKKWLLWGWNFIKSATVWILKGYFDFYKFIFTKIWDFIKFTFESIKNTIVGMWNKIVGITKWVGDKMLEAGENMMKMLVQGIKNKIEDVKNAAKAVAQKIKDFLGFSSPTKEWPGAGADKWMPNMIDMISEGIEKGATKVERATKRVAEAIKDQFKEEKFDEIIGNVETFLGDIQNAFDDVNSQIDAQGDKVVSLAQDFRTLQKSIADINNEIMGVGTDLTSWLAGRSIDLNAELEKLQEKRNRSTDGQEQVDITTKIRAIQDELSYITEQWIKQADINAVIAERGKSEAQRMVEAAQERIKELEEKRAVIQLELDEKKAAFVQELHAYQALTDQKQAIQDTFFRITGENLENQISKTEEAISKLRQLDREAGEASVFVQAAPSASPGGFAVNWGNVNIVFENVNIKDSEDMDRLVAKLDAALTNRLENAKLWIT